MSSPETIHDVVEDILRNCRVPEDRARSYRERMTKAVWRDRTEVLDVIAERDARKEDEAVQCILEAVRDMSRQEAIEMATEDPAVWIGATNDRRPEKHRKEIERLKLLVELAKAGDR